MITYILEKENLQEFDFVKEIFQKIKYTLHNNCKFNWKSQKTDQLCYYYYYYV